MGTGSTHKSDLYGIFNYVQNTMIVHPKELIIETLREYFSKDSYYHYVKDAWGFPLVTDHTNLDPEAGLFDDATTRLYIGEPYRYDNNYYPSILIRSAGSRYVPISMSRNKGAVQYENIRFVDGYGNETNIATPSHFIQAGAWEGSISIDIETKGIRERDELVELISILMVDTRFDELKDGGVLIKGLSSSAPAEIDDRNDKIFKQTVTCEIRSEWRRQVPIQNLIDMINICIEFAGNLDAEPVVTAPNLRITTNIELLNAISNM